MEDVLNKALDKLSKKVIGLYRFRNDPPSLVLHYCSQTETMDVIDILPLACTATGHGMPLRGGRLVLFPDGKTLYQMREKPFEFHKFLTDFNKK